MSRLNTPRTVAKTTAVEPRAATFESAIASAASRLSDYLELTKPRIVVLELIVAGAAACLAARHTIDVGAVLHALAATALVAASASIANQWVERRIDARMRRTANRPLPAGRVTSAEALSLSAVSLVVGVAWLATKVNLTTAALGLTSWVLYVMIYTPLKTRSPINTTVGAVAGAIPILMGWTATGTPLNVTALSLAGVLFLWQFPHFMAIAWLYRADYAKGGYQMLSVADPTGYSAGRQAVVAALVLIPVSVLPVLAAPGVGPLLYVSGAVVLGIGQLAFAVLFFRGAGDDHARLLLRASLVYLPTLLAMLILAPWI